MTTRLHHDAAHNDAALPKDAAPPNAATPNNTASPGAARLRGRFGEGNNLPMGRDPQAGRDLPAGRELHPVLPGRYRLIVSAGCDWSRRVLIVRRLLGLDRVLSVGYVTQRPDGGWSFAGQSNGVDPVLGVRHVDELYAASGSPAEGGTVPIIVDTATGRIVSNDYHVLGLELARSWRPLHAPGAPDLYPDDLRPALDLLNQQLFDDVNNGVFKVAFAPSPEAAAAAWAVLVARLHDLDHRLATRRYLFGSRLTDADIRLFVTLSSFDTMHLNAFPAELREDTPRIRDLPHLWAYARDLFATPGFITKREQVALGILPDTGGTPAGFGPLVPAAAGNTAALWREPVRRDHLDDITEPPGPGGAGTADFWVFDW